MIIFCQIKKSSLSVIVFRNWRSVALSNLHVNVLSELLSSIPAQQNTIPYLLSKNIQSRELTRLTEMVALLFGHS